MKRKVCPKCNEPNWSEPIEKITFYGQGGENADVPLTEAVRHCRACAQPIQVVMRFERAIQLVRPGFVWEQAVIHYKGGGRQDVERLIVG